MASAELSDSFEGVQQWDDGNGNTAAGYRETIELLQEEIARLEQELQLRDNLRWEPGPAAFAALDEKAEAAVCSERGAGSPDEIERLTAELASREETIRLLVDELGRFEAAQAAARAEWEHLTGWVAELERRVEGQDVEALLSENLRLRDARQELADRADAAGRGEALDEKLAHALAERHEAGRQLGQLKDEMKRKQLEHEAAVADLEARLAQASLARPEVPQPEKTPERISGEREIDLRIRALRQNLLEIDEREKEERSRKRLTARLSRLWNRTGPR
jgi:hypothetical protein